MSPVNRFDLRTLVIGLSVYATSIRLVIIGRLIGEPPPTSLNAASYKRVLRWLIPADAPLVVSTLPAWRPW